VQPTATFTVISFFRATKYPLSLDFVLMTIGPALLALIYLERLSLPASHPLVVIGRVPFFYYVAHFWILHALASALAYLRYGSTSLAFLFNPLPSMGGLRLPAVGDLCGVGLCRPAPLSRVSLVCRTEGQAPELVAELFVELEPTGIQHAPLVSRIELRIRDTRALSI
jgi:hypothetical protein